jgi:hypothetical protein
MRAIFIISFYGETISINIIINRELLSEIKRKPEKKKKKLDGS